jgi:hypothetical protein
MREVGFEPVDVMADVDGVTRAICGRLGRASRPSDRPGR